MIYDSAIVGTGPAGLSAALNLKIREKNFIWIGSSKLSDKISKAERISNYPGFVNKSGEELGVAFKSHADAMGIEITEHIVNSIVSVSGHYALMAGSDFYEAKTVILTTGIANTTMLKGESDFIGKGVSYCATCDGNLYRGKNIAVLCNNARFEEEVKFLAGIAAKLYYLPMYKPVDVNADNIEMLDKRIVEIMGENRVNSVRLQDDSLIEVDGVFCLRDSVALSALLPKLATENGHIAVDRSMATNLPGVYAAGDCTGRPYQYAKAIGEGNVAVHSVLEFLSKQ